MKTILPFPYIYIVVPKQIEKYISIKIVKIHNFL